MFERLKFGKKLHLQGAFRGQKQAVSAYSESTNALKELDKKSILPPTPLLRAVKWALVMGLMMVAGVAHAHSFKTGDIKVGHPWAKPTAPGASEAQVFMAFLQFGDKGDQLQGAKTSIAQKAVLVQAAPNGDLSEVAGIDLPPNRGVSLRPGAAYIKLTGLKGGLTAGDKFTVRLIFAAAPAVDVTVFVQDEPTENAAQPSVPSHEGHGM